MCRSISLRNFSEAPLFRYASIKAGFHLSTCLSNAFFVSIPLPPWLNARICVINNFAWTCISALKEFVELNARGRRSPASTSSSSSKKGSSTWNTAFFIVIKGQRGKKNTFSTCGRLLQGVSKLLSSLLKIRLFFFNDSNGCFYYYYVGHNKSVLNVDYHFSL